MTSCATCACWAPLADDPATWLRATGRPMPGECRRLPPVVVAPPDPLDGHRSPVAYCPETPPDHWCGEHRPKKEAAA